MSVRETAKGSAPAWSAVEVEAVRVAGDIGEAVVLAVAGDPIDHRPFDRHRTQHANVTRTARVVVKLW